MSSAAHRAFRAGAPLVLAAAGWALWVRAPGSLVGALTLLVCPGWGLLRLLSVLDRRFGVAGGSLCLSALVLGLVAITGAAHHLRPEELGLRVHLITLLLCAAGGLRLTLHDRWQARQPAHPAPMPLFPRGVVRCLAVLAIVVAAVLYAAPLGRPADGSPLLVQACRALGFQHGGEEPFLAGVAQSPEHLLGAAAASLAAASSVTPVTCVQLLALAALLATLLFAAESISRLVGNRGAAAAVLATLLGLHPLAGLFLVAAPQHHGELSGPPPGYAPPITTAIAPFVDGSDLALPLAFTAMLLFASLSVLRRSSYHVPRLAGAAAFGLALCRPSAAVVLVPGWIAGVACAHLLCRLRERQQPPAPDNPRAGEPRLLRAPFWALAVPIAAGTAGGLLLAGFPDLAGSPAVTTWRLLIAVGPAAVLFIPGVRHLNASPGREGWFFLGLLLVSLPLMVFLGPRGDHGEDAVRLVGLLLAVPAAHGALKLIEWSGRRAVVLLAVVVVLLLPGPVGFLAERAERPRALDERATAPAPHSTGLSPAALAALEVVRRRAPPDAVLVAPAAALAPVPPPLLVLLSERLLLAPGDAAGLATAPQSPAQADELARRASLAADLPTGLRAPLLQLRGTGGLRSRELWVVHAGAAWPGFRPVTSADDLLVERAGPPAIVLVTVGSLRASALTAAGMPAVSALAARGVRFEQALSPLPDTLPSLASLLTGLSPDEHGLRGGGEHCARGALTLASVLAASGYRTAAVAALDDDGGLFAGFEQPMLERSAGAEALVDTALQRLSQADPRPLFLWLHLADPADALAENAVPPSASPPSATSTTAAAPGAGAAGPATTGAAPAGATTAAATDPAARAARYAAAVATVDRALARLLASVPAQDLVVLTAPHGANLGEHELPFTFGHDLYEASVHVPLVLAGAGIAPGVFPGLAALQDVAAITLDGALPQRERLFLQTGSGASAPLRGLRTAHRMVVLAGQPPEGSATAFDLATDPDETRPLPADDASVRMIEAFSRMQPR